MTPPKLSGFLLYNMTPPQPRLEDLRIDRKNLPAPTRRTGLAVGVLTLVAALGLAAWWLNRAQPLALRTATARDAGLSATGARTVLNASGYVTARREATVSSKVTGKVREVLVEEGVAVTEGQILARLDDTNTQASLELARAQQTAAGAQLEETRVRLKDAETEFKRQQHLRAGGAAPQADYDRAETAVLALRARLTQQAGDIAVADRTVGVWQQQLEDTIIRAPFAGIVTSKNAQPGEMISPMSSGGFTRTGICTLVDMASLEVEIDVNESFINRVTPGQAVEAVLDAYPEWKLPCRVIAIIPTADRQKSTVRVRVGFDRLDPRILPEMSVKVAFREADARAATQPAGPTVLVPQGAVRQDAGRDIVFVVTNGRAERRAVRLGGERAGEREIVSGLAAGERVVLEAPPGLADGTAVQETPL